jgi:undecaprenyl diphosphate synthase
MIRTSGEKRISNFLLWQSAYTEFVFEDVLWPDFTAEHFSRACDEFRGRDRRFGAVGLRTETVPLKVVAQGGE